MSKTHEQAYKLLQQEKEDATFPLCECAHRSIGRFLYAEPGNYLLRLPDGAHMLYAQDTTQAKALIDTMQASLLTLCSSSSELLAYAQQKLHLGPPDYFHLGIWPCTQAIDDVLAQAQRDVFAVECRTLDESYVRVVHDNYSHPEFFDDEEIARRLREHTIIGAFNAQGELMGYIGEHVEGSMGMLEVFEKFRHQGVATLLEAYKIKLTLAQNKTPWCQVFEGNEASIRLQQKLGMKLTSAHEQCFLAPNN